MDEALKMRCVANYEIRSDISVGIDGQRLRLHDPKGTFEARISNIVRNDFSTPFLLAVELLFDAPNLDEARDIAEEKLAECLNMFALVAGASVRRHRIKQIVECQPDASGMHDCRFWGDSIIHDDPRPCLIPQTVDTLERFLSFDAPRAIRRALRWYRIGINASVPEDQFQYFWFALEIIAVFQKTPDKVTDTCPDCKSPLYCQQCQTHPVHKPFPKQAIRKVIQTADPTYDHALVDALELTRNRLMHGATLKEIETRLPKSGEDMVDVLGHVLFKALIQQFPRELFSQKLSVAVPTTYIHRVLSGIAHMKTVVPRLTDGDLDLTFAGVKMQMQTNAPPQSAAPLLVFMTHEQHEKIGKLRFQQGEYQKLCDRLFHHIQKIPDGRIASAVLATDKPLIDAAIDPSQTGDVPELLRKIVKETEAALRAQNDAHQDGDGARPPEGAEWRGPF